MKQVRTTLITMLLVLAALPCERVIAQQAEPAAVQRARAGLPPAQAAAFDEILSRARSRGLPTAPLVGVTECCRKDTEGGVRKGPSCR